MREREVLKALQQTEGWVGRRQLANLLGRNSLNQGDTAALAVLTERGIIERLEIPDPRPTQKIVKFRAKQGA